MTISCHPDMLTIVNSEVVKVHACAKLLHLVHYLEIGRSYEVRIVTLILNPILFMKVSCIVYGQNQVD